MIASASQVASNRCCRGGLHEGPVAPGAAPRILVTFNLCSAQLCSVNPMQAAEGGAARHDARCGGGVQGIGSGAAAGQRAAPPHLPHGHAPQVRVQWCLAALCTCRPSHDPPFSELPAVACACGVWDVVCFFGRSSHIQYQRETCCYLHRAWHTGCGNSWLLVTAIPEN